MLDTVFSQISILLGITVTVAFVMRWLRQPLITAYLIAGIVAGPFFLNLIGGDRELFDALSQFGVVLLLFVVGLSLNVEHIKKIGRVAVTTGILQVTLTASIGYIIVRALGMGFLSALYLGIGITFSSTIVIIKLLTDKKDMESVYGRYMLGLMIVQDLIALIVMMVLTSMGQGTVGELLIDVLIKMVVVGALILLLARYVVPKLLHNIAKSSEFLFIFTLAWCFGVASLLYKLGFSVELGAVIAGLTLGSSSYQQQISSRIRPLRDFFIVIFFIILGSELSLSNLNHILLPGLTIAIFILIGNPLILYLAFRMQKFTRRNAFLAGTTAAQVSEFGLILLFTGKQLGHIQSVELEIFTFIALVTIIISSYLITYNEQIYKFFIPFFDLFGKDRHRQKDEKIPVYDVLVFGYHRIGWKVCEALAEKGQTFAVIDFNPDAVQKLKRIGIPAYFGDAADVEFLEQLPFAKVKMVVSTLPEVDDQVTLIKHIRQVSKQIKIIANLYKIESLHELYNAGADYVMMPHLLGGNWIAGVLKDKPWTKKTFTDLQKLQKKEMHLRYTVGTHK
ncbi:cation:proton antiporter [Patescibacteria group bacterium]|nr:cation:proton antiporter [Patescibacteria group bacterium]MBU1721276.1 cation:proton antiporter [Patescibacteria group bacterium]MBU1901016.1 cation:proton antiporter [Patescibacteria group bacterium]